MNLSPILSQVQVIAIVLAISSICKAFRLDHIASKRSDAPGVESPAKAKLFINGAPPETKEARVGANIVLHCAAGGSPSPTIHWLFNGERLTQSSRNDISDESSTFEDTPKNRQMSLLKLSSTKSKLYIDCITPEDQGVYTCVAETPYQRQAVDTQVIVGNGIEGEISESCMVKRNANGVPARVYMWTTQRLEKEGADVQLFCRADGEPRPRVTWIDNNDRKIKPGHGGQEQVLENGDLLIKNIQWLENMGNYKCTAENEFGSQTVETFLYPTSD